MIKFLKSLFRKKEKDDDGNPYHNLPTTILAELVLDVIEHDIRELEKRNQH